jgi:ketosteroid isomerase-like protein
VDALAEGAHCSHAFWEVNDLKAFFRTCAWIVTIIGSLSFSADAASTEPAAVLAAEHAWAQAAADGDASTMASWMSNDYTEIELVPATPKRGAHWTTTTKHQWVADVRSKRERYDYVHLSNLKVFLNGDIATVTGEYTQKATKNGKSTIDAGAYVNTWQKRNGRWQVVNSVFP